MYNLRAVMADIYENRRLRLRQLLEERFEGNQSRFARAVGHETSYFNGIFHGRRNLVEPRARHIEAVLGLPKGWMDCEPPPGAVPKTPFKARRGQPLKVHSLQELLASGYTQRETAQQLGVHESTVSHALKRERAVKKERESKRSQHVAA